MVPTTENHLMVAHHEGLEDLILRSIAKAMRLEG